MVIFGAVFAVFLMLMIPNISAVNEQVKENVVKEKIELTQIIKKISSIFSEEQYDWPILCLIILAAGIALAIIVFVISIVLGKIGTAISNAIATLVGFLQIVAAILGGIGIFAGAAGTIYLWIDYLRNLQEAV